MPLTCTNCGATFAAPPGQDPAAFAAEESARCARLREIAAQRGSLDAARAQAGFAGVTETVDRIDRRASMDRLDMALRIEAAGIAKVMRHQPMDKKD